MSEKIPEYLIWKIITYKLKPHPTAQIIRKYELKKYTINIFKNIKSEINFKIKEEDIIYLNTLWNDIYFELENDIIYYYDCRSESDFF